VINAINHALGTRITQLPALPERIVAALSGL
jgi:CO/xanthine dehydrogenase Mo-binding subunit